MAINDAFDAGAALRYVLLEESPEVTAITRRIYPVVYTEGKLPYIVFRRTGASVQGIKGGIGATSVTMDVLCCAATYPQSVELARAVRSAIDGQCWSTEDLRVRRCDLIDATEDMVGDAFVQALQFEMKL